MKNNIKSFFSKRNILIFLILASFFISLYAYFYVYNNEMPSGRSQKVLMYLILFDLIFILALVIMITVELFKIWVNKKYIIKTSRIQSRIILIFSLIASIPTIIIAIFSALFFYYGVQSWFTERINTAITESVEVANAYLNEHEKLIRADIEGLAYNLNFLFSYGSLDSQKFDSYLTNQAIERSFVELAVFKDNPLSIIAKSRAQISFNFFPKIESLKNAIKTANENYVIIREEDNVTAIVKLDNFPANTYLLVSRLIDPKVIAHIKKTSEAFSDYKNLNRNIIKKQMQFSFAFIIISLLLVLSAILTGILLASAIVKPLLSLINATEKIKDGNFAVKVHEGKSNDEFSMLSKAFNLMTKRLELQHTNLIEANRQIDARRHFSEVIISGVSAGILALDINKEVSMINPQAKAILKINNSNNLSDLVKIFPEVINLLSNLEKNQEESIHEQINISRNNQNIILFVRIIVEILNKEILGYIITFDDVTKLIIAQRSAAWSDVARKVAHEIKNPLTPIHLASQRLQTKYSDEVSDKITFLKYTNTIIKHVSQIGKMVEEFVFFARMPSPQFAFNDVNNIVRDIIFSRECIEHGIKYSLVELANSVVIYSDKEQLSRAFTNLLKNAEESFLDIRNPGNDKKIEVTISKTNKYAIIFIEDSGPGFPENLFNQLTEPYITNKIGGSGLGLAIVKKIIDDHDGIMELINKESGGAKVELLFKLNQNKEQK